jgi:2-keto-4-pentenoate hydratase
MLSMVEAMATASALSIGEALASHRSDGSIADVPLHLISSEARAQEVQDAAVMAYDESIVGYFATATTAVTQRVLQCDKPIFGPLVASAILPDRTGFRLPWGVLGAEWSIGFIIGASYPQLHQPTVFTSFEEAVIGCIPMITILGRRVTSSIPLNPWTATADFGLHVSSSKGEPVFDMRPSDLAGIDVVVSMNDAIVGQSSGRNIIGDLTGAIMMLAEVLTTQGRRLSPGNIIAVGGGPLIMQAVVGQTFRADFGRLGAVQVEFD